MQRVKTGWTWAALMGLSMLAAFMGSAIAAGPARASEVDVLIEKLAQKGLLTRLEAETMRGDIEMAEKASYVQHRGETNPWLEDLTQKGDIRLRYETFSREDEDASDRSRYRARVRWGVEKRFDEEWKAGFRLATGSLTDPTSTNQTLTGDFTAKTITLDQAYAVWTPTSRFKNLFPATKNLEIGAGKVNNPYAKIASTLIWDGDVNPEGIYEKWDLNLANDGGEAFTDLNLIMSQFILNEDSDFNPGDIETFGYGIGVTQQWAKNHWWTFQTQYYDWQDYIGYEKAGGSASAASLGGNDRELSDLKILNFYGAVNFEAQTPVFGKQNVNIYGDFAVNTAAQSMSSTNGVDFSDETLRNNPRDGEDFAFNIGATVGKAKEAGSWQATYEWYYVEPNAVNGAFMESDLGLGFANNKGHHLAWKYMLNDKIELNLGVWLVEKVNTEIVNYYGSGDLRVNGDDNQIVRTQADLVYKF